MFFAQIFMLVSVSLILTTAQPVSPNDEDLQALDAAFQTVLHENAPGDTEVNNEDLDESNDLIKRDNKYESNNFNDNVNAGSRSGEDFGREKRTGAVTDNDVEGQQTLDDEILAEIDNLLMHKRNVGDDDDYNSDADEKTRVKRDTDDDNEDDDDDDDAEDDDDENSEFERRSVDDDDDEDNDDDDDDLTRRKRESVDDDIDVGDEEEYLDVIDELSARKRNADDDDDDDDENLSRERRGEDEDDDDDDDEDERVNRERQEDNDDDEDDFDDDDDISKRDTGIDERKGNPTETHAANISKQAQHLEGMHGAQPVQSPPLAAPPASSPVPPAAPVPRPVRQLEEEDYDDMGDDEDVGV